MIKLLRNRKFQIISAVVLLLIVVLLSADRFSKVNIIRNIVTTPVTLVQKGVKATGDWIGGIVSGIRGYAEAVDDNRELREENLKLKEHIAVLSDVEEENQRLRDALKLKDRFDGYDIVGANIVGTDPGNFLYDFRIDAGSIDGISIDDPVVASNNVLVGRVYSVSLTSAVIKPLIDELSGISAWTVKEEGGHGTVKGDLEFKSEGLCLMDNIHEDVILRKNDIVETSGMGGIYPRGILIGTVVEIRKETSLIERYALVKPYIDFNAIEEVYILVGKDPGGE